MNVLSIGMTEEHRNVVKERLVRATLKWCNERRADNQLPPLGDLPKGRRYEGESCPCGMACGYYVGYRGYFRKIPNAGTGSAEGYGPYQEGNKIGAVPFEVSEFAKAFDYGWFPEYESR